MWGVEHPERIAVAPDRDSAAFVVGPGRAGPSSANGVWWGRLDGSPGRVAEQVPATDIAFDPDGSRLAFGVQGPERSQVLLLGIPPDGAQTSPRSLSAPGYVEALSWSEQGLIALSAEPGADSASLHSGRPLPSADEDPRVARPDSGWRRLWCLDPAGDREPEPFSPAGLTVWEFAPVPAGRSGFVAVCSESPGEDGWYRPCLVHFTSAQDARILHRSLWQLSSPAADPRGERIAWIEGWASDRGLLAGELRVTHLDGGAGASWPLRAGIDATSLSWDASGALWFAGWDGLGTAWGWFETSEPDAEPVLHREPAGCVNSRWHPAVVPAGAGAALTVRSTPDEPPEVIRCGGARARRWSALNAGAERERPFAVRAVAWAGSDGTEIEGLLALPRDHEGRPPLVVDIHGGPSIAWHRSWTMPWAEVLTRSAIAVLMPNPRGGVGRGQAFGRLNLGDPAGAELEDVVAGVRRCAADGLIDGERVGAIGASYGGYLTACAVCRPEVFRCGVVIAGMSDLLSARGTANNSAFYDFLLGGSPAEVGTRYLERSPVLRVGPDTAPTLVLHGEQDRCVPVGQAYELHHALRSAGVTTELVVYPREGHQLHEPGHREDQERRVVEWFERHLVQDGPEPRRRHQSENRRTDR